MSIPITCPQCEKTLDVPDSAAGRRVKCRCGSVLPVPAADAGLDLDDERDADERPRRVKRRSNSMSSASVWAALRLMIWLGGVCGAGLLGLSLLGSRNQNVLQQTGTSCEVAAYAIVWFVLVYSADQVCQFVGGMTSNAAK